MQIGLDIITDRRVGVKFDVFPKQAHDAILQRITSVTEQLRGMVEAAAPKQTGRLAMEISSRVLESENRITGMVGVSGGTPNDYAKAAALEYGAHGTAHVKEHATKLGHLWGRIVAPM